MTNLDLKEDKVLRDQFSICNNIDLREDVIFTFPSVFKGDVKHIADKLQSTADLLKYLTNRNPANYFKSRIIVGFTEKSRHPNWSGTKGNRIQVPIGYSKKENEPLDACSHEIVHPFFRCSPLHNKNEGWGDGFCEFLRGPIKNLMDLNGDELWRQMIKAANDNIDSEYHYPGGQFILKAYEYYEKLDVSINELINNNKAIRGFIEYLYSNFEHASISTFIKPSPKMIKKWKNKGKL